ncbi:MAG: NAD(P)H-dependent oxidoreductase [Chloroflexota bacterium]|nr:NAD(P)H-dependent oxidoreductase [Chloroflexota bacterium]
MAHLLHLDSSARTAGSISRQLTAEFAEHWKSNHPEDHVTYRDLASNPLPHIQEATVAAMFIPPAARTPEQTQATALQEELIAELAEADTLLIGAPMYNFGVPSALKSWIDHVVVFGRTIGQGLFDDTTVVIASARGGAYGPGTPREASDFQERYLRAILSLIGLTDITFAHAEMRAAADGDPSLAQFAPFAGESLAAAQAMMRAAAARPRGVPAPQSGTLS